MCGIAGIVAADRLHPDEGARAVLMRDVLTHRGPDGAGLHGDETAILAHRRLSIVDLAGGHQPLANENGTIWVTFNGEIYNHGDIRPQLEAAGHRYRTRSDTETIVHAYEQWGDDCVHQFRGMFAFGIWDAPRRRLLLVRDRLGVKPLYWSLVPAAGDRGPRLLFASEIKAILESGLVPARPNTAVLSEVLATRYTSDTETLFEGIHKLLPGHQLVFERGRAQVRQYWDIPLDGPDPALEHASDDELVERFRSLLQESVKLRLMADVPLGMFLSGGIDSSAVAALMARQIDRPVETFSVAFEDRAFSELEYARQVARAVGANGHEIVISDEDFFGALPKMVWHEDEPIAHPSSVPLHFVSALARKHVTVVLTGEGSDELLAGYGKYPRALLNWQMGGVYERMVPAALRSTIASAVVPRMPAGWRRYASRSFLAMQRDPATMFLDNFAGIPLAQQRHLLQMPVTADSAYASSLGYFNAARGGLLGRVLYTDIKTYLVELLMKQDQMSMSASIESRVPFLDHRLVEFASRLPDRMRLSGFTTKRILRDALRGQLPESILTRKKMGFPVPFAGWVAQRWLPVAREVLLDRRARERGIVDSGAVERLLNDHQAGVRRGGDAIWALLNLELWYRTFIDGDGVQTLPSPDAAGATRARVHSRLLRRPDVRILWLNANLLLPLDKGGKLRTWHLMRHLAARHEITYVSFADPTATDADREGMREVCHQLHVVPRRDPPKGSLAFYADAGARILDPLPYAAGKYRSREYASTVATLLATGGYDLVVCDFLVPAVNMPQVLPCPAVVFTHNVEAEIWRRHMERQTNPVHRALYRQQWRRMLRFEAQTLQRFDLVLAVSDADRDTFQRLYPDALRAPVLTVATGVDTSFFAPRPADVADPRHLVFTGSMDWIPNEDAMQHFCHDVLPLVRAQEPAVTLSIVGRAPTPAVQRLAAIAGVTVTGRVDDVRDHVGRAGLYVVPIRIGGGTRLKIFEAMGMARAVVSTAIGAEGLPVTDGRDIVLADAPAEFAAAIVALIRDPARRVQLERAGRDLVVARYDWSAVAGQLEEALSSAASRRDAAAA